MLVASARHCCVCHRYKGVKVEVHHIILESKGGPNTSDNAIALCFDCHTDAGHYNPHHPKGTKYSPEELRKARDTWLQLVRENNIELPSVSDLLLTRYYVCKSFQILVEISELDFSHFPAKDVLLHKNHIFSAVLELLRRHPGRYRQGTAQGRFFESQEEYLNYYRHPEDLADEKGRFPYYCGQRNPTHEDIETLSKIDGVANAMQEYGMPPEEVVAVVGCFEDACSGIELYEEYLLREVWCVFLAIENLSPDPITLDHIEGSVDYTEGFGRFDITPNTIELDLPKAPIRTGQTVIVPVAVVLPQLGPIKIDRLSSEFPQGISERYLSISHCSIDPKDTSSFLTYGGVIKPQLVKISSSEGRIDQMVHDLDLNNFYEVDMAWGAGSCPHLFYVATKIMYVRELLAHCENVIGRDEIEIPEGIIKIVIAELEDEISEFECIKVNGIEIVSKLRLEKGQTIEVDVNPGDQIQVVGRYLPVIQTHHELSAGRYRNAIIHEFLSQNA